MEPACLSTRCGVVGVLATARSLGGGLFRRTAARYGENSRVLTAVGEGFVELVEEDREQSPEAVETVRRVLEPMIREGADQIVLGCTHYPFLLPVFRQVIGERGVAVVDPAPAVGRRVGQLLDQYDLRAEKGAAANYGFLTFADFAFDNPITDYLVQTKLQSLGEEVELRLYKPRDKQKEFTGILKSFDADSVIIETEEEEKVFARSEIALIRLAFDF